MTTILPVSCGPSRRIRSSARIALGLPPRTIGASRDSALRVAGPQVPSGGHADVALEVADRPLGLVAEAAVDLADLEAQVEQPLLQREHVVARRAGCPATWVSSRSPSRQRASSRTR